MKYYILVLLCSFGFVAQAMEEQGTPVIKITERILSCSQIGKENKFIHQFERKLLSLNEEYRVAGNESLRIQATKNGMGKLQRIIIKNNCNEVLFEQPAVPNDPEILVPIHIGRTFALTKAECSNNGFVVTLKLQSY